VFYEANGCMMPKYGGVDPSEIMREDDSKKRFLIDMLVHAADVSNTTKSWDSCKTWAFMVMDEFYSQGDYERELGLPFTSPMYNRHAANIAVTQLNFAEFLV
jgi:hypothetical protein